MIYRIFALLLALMLSACGPDAGTPSKTPFQGTDITGVDWGKDLQLTDHTGKRRSLTDFHGKVVVLFFGYTHCPDVCPSTLYDLNLVSAQLSRPGGNGEAPLQVVFVSVDPERDSPATLSRYVAYFNPEFTGVSGTHEELAALTRQLGIAYQIGEHKPGAETYDVLHSSSVVLTDPDGQLRGAFTAPLDADRMARELAMVFGLAD